MGQEFLIIILFLIGFSWLVLRRIYPNQFRLLFRSVVSLKSLSEFKNELNNRLNFFLIFSEFLSYIIFGLFLVRISEIYNLQPLLGEPFQLIFYSVLSLLSLNLLKSLIMNFISLILPIREGVVEHFIIIRVYNSSGGLIIYPFLFILYFSPIAIVKFVIITLVIAFIVYFLIKILMIVTNLLHSFFSIFGILLYLCALEIVPLLVLFQSIRLLA